MKDYDVHFSLNGYVRVEANSVEEAEEIAEEQLNNAVPAVEQAVSTAVGVEVYETVEGEEI